jgi:hypothetical protein
VLLIQKNSATRGGFFDFSKVKSPTKEEQVVLDRNKQAEARLAQASHKQAQRDQQQQARKEERAQRRRNIPVNRHGDKYHALSQRLGQRATTTGNAANATHATHLPHDPHDAASRGDTGAS